MTENKVKPFERCTDYWPVQIPKTHLAAYKVMIARECIADWSVVYNRTTGSTTVTYTAIAPQEWIRQEMHNIVMDFMSGEQMQLEATT